MWKRKCTSRAPKYKKLVTSRQSCPLHISGQLKKSFVEEVASNWHMAYPPPPPKEAIARQGIHLLSPPFVWSPVRFSPRSHEERISSKPTQPTARSVGDGCMSVGAYIQVKELGLGFSIAVGTTMPLTDTCLPSLQACRLAPHPNKSTFQSSDCMFGCSTPDFQHIAQTLPNLSLIHI